MSHHLDTPLASQNGQLYLDHLYVFQGNASTVFVMDVNSNITGVHVKPGFHTEARYEFKVHFDGADFETLNLPSVLWRTGILRMDNSTCKCTLSLVPRRATTPQPEDSCWKDEQASPASEDGIRICPGRIAGSLSTSTYRYSRSSTVQSKMVPRWTSRHGARKTPRTASLTRRSTRSSWKSHMSIRSCGPVPALDFGPPRNSPRTRAAGGRSTAPWVPP